MIQKRLYNDGSKRYFDERGKEVRLGRIGGRIEHHLPPIARLYLSPAQSKEDSIAGAGISVPQIFLQSGKKRGTNSMKPKIRQRKVG